MLSRANWSLRRLAVGVVVLAGSSGAALFVRHPDGGLLLAVAGAADLAGDTCIHPGRYRRRGYSGVQRGAKVVLIVERDKGFGHAGRHVRRWWLVAEGWLRRPGRRQAACRALRGRLVAEVGFLGEPAVGQPAQAAEDRDQGHQGDGCRGQPHALFLGVHLGRFVEAEDVLRQLVKDAGVFLPGALLREINDLRSLVNHPRHAGLADVDVALDEAFNGVVDEVGALGDEDEINALVTVGVKGGHVLGRFALCAARREMVLALVDDDDGFVRGSVVPVGDPVGIDREVIDGQAVDVAVDRPFTRQVEEGFNGKGGFAGAGDAGDEGDHVEIALPR